VSLLYTIGHSTRSAEELRDLLADHGVKLLVDVRRFPGSKRYPHFSAESMPVWLAEAGIDYVHEPDLGGRRSATAAASANAYWRSASFRAYADYMATPTFREALERLQANADRVTTAIMCSEAVPWRCHRQLISDALVAGGAEVVDIMGPSSSRPHVMNPHARIQPDGTLNYPADQQELFG